MKLVSVIMPTRGRRVWAPLAVRYFLAQTYPLKELVILDDEDDPSFPNKAGLPNDDASIRYMVGPRRLVPVKRNVLGDASRGELICHFDSDDWQHPERIATQVKLQEESGKGLIGFYTLLLARMDPGKEPEGFRYTGPKYEPCGSGFMYTRELFRKYRFREHIKIGSDMYFVREAHNSKNVLAVDIGGLMVMRVHAGNLSPKQVRDKSHYAKLAWTELPELFRTADLPELAPCPA